MTIKEWNKECFGCGACVDICPQKAVSMHEDYESFCYPVIDRHKCVDCGLCESVCPLKHIDFQSTNSVRSYVGTHKTKDIMYESSSGGAFTAIYQVLIKDGFIIYGAKYLDRFKVAHGRAVTEDECKLFRKSKYVQSDTVGIFNLIEQDLINGNKVLFSGVSCQCAALISYLDMKRISKDNLLTINILCHGVPSQAIFDKYIKEEEEKEKSHVCKYSFKNKIPDKDKVNSRTAYVEFANGHKYIRSRENDPFIRGYYSRLFYRPSCATCHFTRSERITDFTIADAWGIQKIKPNYSPIKGVSLILFNTERAKNYFNAIDNIMDLEEVSPSWALASQQIFKMPTEVHENREKFFKLWRKKSFNKTVFECTSPHLKQKLWRLLPQSIRSRILSLLKR